MGVEGSKVESESRNKRTMSSLSQRRRRRLSAGRRRPARRVSTELVITDFIPGNVEGGCIDLTSHEDTETNPIVDLTNSSVNDTPVVVINSQSPPRRRRRLNRRGDSIRLRPDPDSSDSEVEVLPDLPFDLSAAAPIGPTASTSEENATTTTPSTSLNGAANTSLFSPPAKSISCPVCLDSERVIRSSNRQLMSTNCGHVFCNECIQSAVNAQRKCPNCRKKLTMKQVHPLFL